MFKKIIIIDGSIGPYSYSKQFIRHEFEGQANKSVLVQISSLGGAVDHALNIYDQFIAHGDITVELSSFVASSATIIALGAKHTRMNENSFYLIHKVWQWVDEWGSMNEDDIQAMINKLEKTKKDLATVTLQIAKMYVKKTGKTLEEIIALMKEERWLTAEEAKQWGFVDEVFAPEVAQNYLDDTRMVAMINSNGYPAPKRKSAENKNIDNPEVNSGLDEDTLLSKLWTRFLAKIKSDSENQNSNTKSMKQFTALNSALKVEKLEAVDNKVSLNKEQIGLIAASIGDTNFGADAESIEMDEIQLGTLNMAITAVVNAKNAQTTAETNLENAIESLDEIDQTVADAETIENKTKAIRTILAAQPGGKPADTKGGETSNLNDEVDWDAINALEHNQNVD